MSQPWMKVLTNIGEAPEVLAIADELDVPDTFVVGAVVRFWCWCDSNSSDGTVSLSVRRIEKLVDLPGFVAAMLSAGWLKEQGETLVIPNWDRHNGKGAKARATSQRRQQKARENPVSRCDRDGVAEPVTLLEPKSVTKPPVQRDRSVTNPPKSVTREEKSRGEERREEHTHCARVPDSGDAGEWQHPASVPRSLEQAIGNIQHDYPKTGRSQKQRASRQAIVLAIERIQTARQVTDTEAGEWLTGRVRAFAASPAGKLGRFVPDLVRWLEDGSYDDDDADWQKAGKGSSGEVNPLLRRSKE